MLLEIDDVVDDVHRPEEGRTAIDIPEVTRAEAGDPRTFLILGSDERYGDRKLKIKPRSDTILLVRVDPDTKRIAVMSIPRDLKVQIPGAGTGKINAAYEIGGPRKTVATIKRLFEDATGEDFPINNVINVNFGGFRRAVNYVGGVYVDVDRRYYNDNTTAAPGEAYATIDVQPGYQKLKGQDALDYVRYRHGDNDFFRASRQQDFLRQMTHQDAIRALLDVEQAQGAGADLRPLLRGRQVLRERLEPDRAGPDRPVPGRPEGAGQRGPLPGLRGREPGGRQLPLRQGLRAAQDLPRVHDRQGLLEPAPRRRETTQGRPPSAGQAEAASATSRRRSRASSRRRPRARTWP